MGGDERFDAIGHGIPCELEPSELIALVCPGAGTPSVLDAIVQLAAAETAYGLGQSGDGAGDAVREGQGDEPDGEQHGREVSERPPRK